MNEKVGFGVRMTINNKGTDTKLFGQGVENLKKEIKEEIVGYIGKEIIKPENEKIKQELEEIKIAISNKDKSLLKKALERLIEKGTEKGLDIIVKIIFAKLGIDLT